MQRLRELGPGGELPLKKLLRDLVKATRKAMRQQVLRPVRVDAPDSCSACGDGFLVGLSLCRQQHGWHCHKPRKASQRQLCTPRAHLWPKLRSSSILCRTQRARWYQYSVLVCLDADMHRVPTSNMYCAAVRVVCHCSGRCSMCAATSTSLSLNLDGLCV